MKELLLNKTYQIMILKWCAYWLLAMGFFMIILKPLGITHKDNTPISGLYFIVITAIGGHLYNIPAHLKKLPHWKTLLFLTVMSSLLFILVPTSIHSLFPITNELTGFLIKKEYYFPLFTYPISTIKVLDILFQQTLIYGLVALLADHISGKKNIIFLFTFSFFFIHLPLVFIFGWLSILFIVPSLLAGWLFSYTILSYKYGVLYSILLHQVFYLISGIVMRIL